MIAALLTVVFLTSSLMTLTHARDVDIYKLHIVSDIAYRFATTNVTSYLVNRANTSKEAEFQLTIPDEAFINKFFMVIDEKIYHGTVKGKEEAQKQYDDAKNRGQSAGQVRRRANTKDNIFEVQVNIAAESKIEFSLTYQELLQRKLGIYEHVINLDPGQVVKDLQVIVNIRESRKIVLLEVPELRKEHQNSIVNQENPHAVVDRPSDKEAVITYTLDSTAQKEASEDGIAGQFVVEYDVERTSSGGELLVVDGYFVHFFAPSGLDPVAKDIMFILDVSGSMSGNKLSQLKIAMDKIVDSLRPGDRFNIITFASNSELWETEGLLLANPSNLERARQFVGNLQTRGSTNINDALLQGIEFLKTHKTTSETTKRPAVVIFLTDGMPNESESNPIKIALNLVQANEGYASVFSLGFGNDVEFDFLKSLSLQNDGFARKIYVDADPVLQLQNFYEEVSTPLLTDVKIRYLGNTVDEETVTPTCFLNFFKGSEIVVAGRLRDVPLDNIVSQVSAGSSTGLIELDVEASVTEDQNLTTIFDVTQFTERLWAYMTIKKMLDTKLQTTDANITEEANEEALALALKYQFVTPLTSMVVTKPNQTEELIEEVEEPEAEYSDHIIQHAYSLGLGVQGPVGARSSINQYNSPMYYSPPYLSSPGRPYSGSIKRNRNRNSKKKSSPVTTTSTPAPRRPKSICLTVSGRSGDIFQLIFDKSQNLVVNGKVRIPRQLPANHNGQMYFARVAIMHSRVLLLVKPGKVQLNRDRFNWDVASSKSAGDISFSLSAEDDLIVHIGRVLTVKFKSHRYFLEMEQVTSQLDQMCSLQQSSQSNAPTNNAEVRISHMMANSECLHAYIQQTRSCDVISNNQWSDVRGTQMRYRVPNLTFKDFAVEETTP